MKREQIVLVNRQPKCLFRAHFEFVVNRQSRLVPSGSLNLWYAIVMIYASIFRYHDGKYGTYDCTDAIEFVFGREFYNNLRNINLN